MRIPSSSLLERLSLFLLPSSPETSEHVLLRIRARNAFVEQSPRRVSPPRQALFSVQRLPHDLRDIRSREHFEDIEQKDASHHVLERINVRRYQRLAKRKRVSIVRGK